MSDFDFDLFVIGAGSGGVRAGRMAAQFGAKVAVAEEYRVGGTCVIRGCVPKKLFVYASHFGEDFEDAHAFGWDVKKPSFNWQRLIANKDKEIERLSNIYVTNLERAGGQIIRERAVLEGPNTVRLVGSQKTVTARTILIATGAWPFMPDNIPGIEYASTSNEAFHLDHLPERVIINGGGYIAVEFAGIFNGLGADTTLVYRGEEILRGFDDDLRHHLHEEMTKKGIKILTDSLIEKIEKSGDRFLCTVSGHGAIETDFTMFALGRDPYVKGLGLEKAGVNLTPDGAIAVDRYSQTNVESIYAVGDVTDRAALTPVAIREGAAFAETVFNNNPTAVDHSMIPTAVFSQPEIGTVGLSEAEARKKGHEVTLFKSSFRPLKNTISGNEERMLMKIIVDTQTDKVLGVHIAGPDAGEMVQCLGIALQMGATKAQFDATIAVHPTAAEELVTMREPWQPK